MFLYCKLVLDNLASQIYLEDIQKEIDNLPEGLDEAFVSSRHLLSSSC